MKQKILGIILTAIVYIASLISSLFISELFEINILLKALLFNIALVIIIGIFSLVIKNNGFIKGFQIVSTFTTLVICNVTISHDVITLIITIPVMLLLISQSINHIINYQNVTIDNGFIDYFKNKKGYTIFNLLINYGLRMIVVYLINLPIIAFFNLFREKSFTNPFNVSTIISILLLIIGIIIYLVSIIERFKEKEELYPKKGIYQKARFPEIGAKILFYFGLYLVVLSLNSTLWVLFLCPLAYLLVHVLLIIPIKEKQLILLNENYLAKKKNTYLFLFFLNK